MKRIPWKRDEYILILDLYFRYQQTAPSKSDPILEQYSELLRSLNHEAATADIRYRNVNGVYLRLMNYRACDPFWLEQGRVGMSAGSSGKCKEIWEEFCGDVELVSALASDIEREIELAHISVVTNTSDARVVREGQRRLRIHHSRERKSQRVAKLAEFRRVHGSLYCEACGFTSTKYPLDVQDSVFEVHHIIPLSEADGLVETRLNDLAVLCANCHRAIHATEPMYSIDMLLS